MTFAAGRFRQSGPRASVWAVWHGRSGRQVVKKQLYIGGSAPPWGNVGQFVELSLDSKFSGSNG